MTGVDPWPWFRFPYGDYNEHAISVVNGAGFVPVGWTVDTLGWKGTSGGITTQTVVNRVLGGLRPGEIVLMHCGSNPDDHSSLDANALPAMIQDLRARGYSFVTVDALRGVGYHVLTSNGGVHNYGAPWYGSDAYKLPAGVTATGIAADPATGGYWILKSDGGVDAFGAPWHGSMRGHVPAGRAVIGIAGTANGGYLILTSDGGVHSYGTPWYGSDAGKLPAGMTATGFAADPATGGYWIVKSDGTVDAFHAPWHGSAPMRGQAVTGIAGTPGGGYLMLTSDGGVQNYGTPVVRLRHRPPAGRGDRDRDHRQPGHRRVLDRQVERRRGRVRRTLVRVAGLARPGRAVGNRDRRGVISRARRPRRAAARPATAS